MGILYVVATPIGNLDDITLRALQTFKDVDVIACEDTRRTRILLSHYSIITRTISFGHDNSRVGRITELLGAGQTVALVTDAGTPGISDPGSGAVRAARAEGHPVVPIPGVSILTALLSVSGQGLQGIKFYGFCSPKSGRRRSQLKQLLSDNSPFVLFEAPHRILKTLRELSLLVSHREIMLARELTKLHEEILFGSPDELSTILSNRNKIVGEFALLVMGKK